MRHSNQAISSSLLLRVTCVFWIAAKIICYRLWMADRLFPLAPIWERLATLPAVVHTALYCLSLAVLVACIILPRQKALVLLLLTTEVASCAMDQNRWQPWEYQYLLTLVILLVNWSSSQVAASMVALMLAATYCYSGLNKLTPGFLSSDWDKLIMKSFLKLPIPTRHNPYIYYSGYLLGVLELSFGLGLCLKKTAKAAALLLIAMHLFVLLWLGPMGIKHNAVVWPWNVAMIAYLFLFFFRDRVLILSKATFKGWVNWPIAALWVLMPVLCFWGAWDNYLSANLYSGRQPYLMMCINNPNELEPLKQYLETDSKHLCGSGKVINVGKWAFHELMVPPYPERRVFEQIKRAMQQRFPESDTRFFVYANAYSRADELR
jgi:hypothetical protein